MVTVNVNGRTPEWPCCPPTSTVPFTPQPGQLTEWLTQLTELGLIEAGFGGWHMTDDGWRAVNLMSWPAAEE